MSEMVERVATALRAACLEEFGTNWNNDVAWKFARAAIAAMREPTEEMIRAAWEFTGDPCWLENVGKAYRAAIEAALKQPESPL